MSDSILVALIVVIGWTISVCFHEYAHAVVAYWGGDKSVKSKGYLSFNPFLYTDIRFSIILPTVFILLGGIGLPGAAVRIRDDMLRHRYWSSLVSAAGPFATFLWILGMIAVIHSGQLSEAWALALCWLLNIEIVVLLLNLLPLPGLDGFGIIEPFLSSEARKKIQPLYKHGFLIMIALLWLIPGPNQMLWETAGSLMELAGIPEMLVEKGHELYREGSFPVAGTALGLAAIAYFVNQRRNWFERGLKMLESGDYYGCINLMHEVLKKKEESKAYRLIALAYLEMALRISKKDAKDRLGYLHEALAAADKAVALDAESHENFLTQGLICLEYSDKQEAALTALNKTLELHKRNEYAITKKCYVLFNLGRFEELLATAEAGLKELPDSVDLLYSKAIGLHSLGRLEEALATYELCLAKGASPQSILNNIMLLSAHLSKVDLAQLKTKEFLRKADFETKVQFYIGLKAYDEAISLVEDSLKANQREPRALFLKSCILFYRGQYEESMQIADQLIEMKNELRTNLYNKACCLAKLNRAEEAVEYLAKAAEIDKTAISQAKTDDDLSAIWELDSFKKLLS